MATTTIWGVVNADGSIASGTGYKVDKLDSGVYTVLFNVSFNSLPAVVTTQLYPNERDTRGGDPRDNSVVGYISTDRCRVITGEDDGDKVDRAFSFIAMGSGN